MTIVDAWSVNGWKTAGPLFDHLSWQCSHARSPLEAPLDDGVVRAELRVLSLVAKEGKSTFGGVAGILAKF